MPTYPAPPVTGTIVEVLSTAGEPYHDRVVGFDPSDGAVILAGGEIVANHLGDGYSRFEVVTGTERPGDCPRCNSFDDDLNHRGGICETCYRETRGL